VNNVTVNQGKIVGQLEHLRNNNGNTIDTNTMFDFRERPVVRQITIRDTQGHVESRTTLNVKLLPLSDCGSTQYLLEHRRLTKRSPLEKRIGDLH
jgi:hypothetical protein